MKKFAGILMALLIMFSLTGCIPAPDAEEVRKSETGNVATTQRTDNADGSYTIKGYNKKDIHISTEEYTADGVISLFAQFDKNGRKISDTVYDGNGKVRKQNEYDENGLCTLTQEYENGVLQQYCLYEYSDSGVRTAAVWYDKDDVKVYMDEFENGTSVIRTTTYNRDGSVASVLDFTD